MCIYIYIYKYKDGKKMTLNVEISLNIDNRQFEFMMACSASCWPQIINFAINNQ